jgi:hypothetical protein
MIPLDRRGEGYPENPQHSQNGTGEKPAKVRLHENLFLPGLHNADCQPLLKNETARKAVFQSTIENHSIEN